MKRVVEDECIIPGSAHHTLPFVNFYTQKRVLEPTFIPSIVYSKIGNTVNDLTKMGAKSERRNYDDTGSDHSQNSEVRALKHQQASVDRLYFHEGDPGKTSDRHCACARGERRHIKLKKRFIICTGKSKQVWNRLTRTASVPKVKAP